MSPVDALFAISTLINQIRKNIQPSSPVEYTNDSSIGDSKEYGESGKIAPYYTAPPSDPLLEKKKQEVIDQSGYREVVKNYLKNIPISQSKDKLEDNMVAYATDDPTTERYIVISKDVNMDNRALSDYILNHELKHTAQLIPTSLLPINKEKEKQISDIWGTKDKDIIKKEQFAEGLSPSIIYKYLLK